MRSVLDHVKQPLLYEGMNTMDENRQVRRFSVTVWPGHLRDDWKKDKDTGEWPDIGKDELMIAYRQWWAALGEFPNLLWRKGQVEVDDSGKLHIQAAIRLQKSQRSKTLRRRLGGHFEPARSWDALVNYVQKTQARVEFLGEDGELPGGTRTEGYGSAKQRAIEALRDGLTPTDIALTDPDAYFTHWRSIEALWEKIKDSGR